MRGDNAVRGRDVTLEERRKIGIRRAVRKHPPDEAIAERAPIGREALRHAELVTFEAIGQHRQIFPFEPFADGLDFVRCDFNACRIVHRQRRLREHRRQHRRFEHHGQREVSGKPHPDGADAGTAALAMRKSSQRPQPLRHGTGLI